MIDLSKSGTFSTRALEEQIERLLAEIGPLDRTCVSFGVNRQRWEELEASVQEYMRLVRNVFGRACN